MREFKTRLAGTVDLDDPETYNHLTDDLGMLDLMMFAEIGKALVYTRHWFPSWDRKQVRRIRELIKNFADGRMANLKDVLWYKEQLFLFQDETENMC